MDCLLLDFEFGALSVEGLRESHQYLQVEFFTGVIELLGLRVLEWGKHVDIFLAVYLLVDIQQLVQYCEPAHLWLLRRPRFLHTLCRQGHPSQSGSNLRKTGALLKRDAVAQALILVDFLVQVQHGVLPRLGCFFSIKLRALLNFCRLKLHVEISHLLLYFGLLCNQIVLAKAGLVQL